MKRTQRTDSISTIRRQIVSYISVIVIAALAASIFLSVSFASKTILNNGDDYYKQGNWRDAELYYNYGARQDDIDYFASTDIETNSRMIALIFVISISYMAKINIEKTRGK